MEVKEKIKSLLQQLNEGIYEKEEVMALALLSSIAGESIFLLGPPGVAKSLIARRLKYAYKNAKVFEYLMSRFSTPDEIFGPVSISELKNDKYVRIIDNYLPSAEVVFLDEIWKAGPSIQNALLTIINEKIFRNGEKEMRVPMKALISASNELPSREHDQGQGLDALWDRFLVRLVVEGIKDQKKFNEMIDMGSTSFDENKIDDGITNIEYYKWSEKIDKIGIPENIFNVIDVIRNKIELHNQNNENAKNQIYVSDRRWRKIVRLMRTSAFLNERKEADLMDCFLIKHCIWNEGEEVHRRTVSEFVENAIKEYGPSVDLELKAEKEQLTALEDEVKERTKKRTDDKLKVYRKSNTDYYKLVKPFQGKYYFINSQEVDNETTKRKGTKVDILSDDNDSISCYIKIEDGDNSIEVGENDYSPYPDYKPYKLRTKPVFEPYKESPTQREYQTWNNDTDKLLSVLNEKKEKANNYWKTFSESFYGNLFINKEYADEHIKSKIDTVIRQIDDFIISINGIRNNYQRVYKNLW